MDYENFEIALFKLGQQVQVIEMCMDLNETNYDHVRFDQSQLQILIDNAQLLFSTGNARDIFIYCTGGDHLTIRSVDAGTGVSNEHLTSLYDDESDQSFGTLWQTLGAHLSFGADEETDN